MVRTSITSSSAISHGNLTGRGEGGGVAVRGGTLNMEDGSYLQNNFASSSGKSLMITGDVTYVFPAAPATWVAARSCKVYRQACETTDDILSLIQGAESDCDRTQERCSLIANHTAMVENTECRPPLLIQPCDCELQLHSNQLLRPDKSLAW